MAVTRVDGVGDLLPIFLAQIAAVEVEIAAAPGVNESGGGVVGPAILAKGKLTGSGGVRLRGGGIGVEISHGREREKLGIRKGGREKERGDGVGRGGAGVGRRKRVDCG